MLFQIGAALVISNRGRFITNWGRYFKSGQIYFKSGQLFQIGAIISNRCRTRASILPFVSKMYEIVIFEETSNYFEPFLNESLSCFRHNILYLIY